MPEVPELAGVVHFLRARIAGARIADVQVGAISAIKTADPPFTTLSGAQVRDIRTRGKFLILDIFGDTAAEPEPQELVMAIHLSRAGWLRWSPNAPSSKVRMGRGPLAARMTFIEDAGELAGALDITEAGTQKRLAIYLVRDLAAVPAISRLGPDVMSDEFTLSAFGKVLAAGKGRQLKTILRDQSLLAGVGNAYSDEILFAARLSPTTPASSLDTRAQRALYETMRSCLQAATDRAIGIEDLAKLKDGKRTNMAVHGRTGKPCPVCGEAVLEVSNADSAHQYCATCQNNGKPLANRRMSRLLK